MKDQYRQEISNKITHANWNFGTLANTLEMANIFDLISVDGRTEDERKLGGAEKIDVKIVVLLTVSTYLRL
jgi:hypothetical protein